MDSSVSLTTIVISLIISAMSCLVAYLLLEDTTIGMKVILPLHRISKNWARQHYTVMHVY